MSRKNSIILLAVSGLILCVAAVFFVYTLTQSEILNSTDSNSNKSNDSSTTVADTSKNQAEVVTDTDNNPTKDSDSNLETYDTSYFSLKYPKDWIIQEKDESYITLVKDHYIYRLRATSMSTGAGFGKMIDGFGYWTETEGINVTDKLLRSEFYYNEALAQECCHASLPNDTWYGSYIYTQNSSFKTIYSAEYFGTPEPTIVDGTTMALANKVLYYAYEDMHSAYFRMDFDTNVELVPPVKGDPTLIKMITEMDEITKSIVFKK